jgi:hypothetical protein
LRGNIKYKNIWNTEEEIIGQGLNIGFGYVSNYLNEEIRTIPERDIYRLVNLK